MSTEFPNHDPADTIVGEVPPDWPTQRHQPPIRRQVNAMLFFISLAANIILLLSLFALVVLGRNGLLAPGNSAANGNLASANATTSAHSASATAASRASSSTPVNANWLEVTPSQIQLGCSNNQQTQTIMLANSGPNQLHWHAVLSRTGDRAGVSLSPDQGNLNAGASVAIQVQDRFHTNGQQGTIRFVPDTSAAGAAPSLSYSTAGCEGN